MSYFLAFTIAGLPKITSNGNKGSWRGTWANARKWKNYVHTAVRARTPSAPLQKAQLILIRHSSSEPDYDGLVVSFKPVVDGLVEAGVLINDKSANIGQPHYRWVKAPRNKGFVSVELRELES